MTIVTLKSPLNVGPYVKIAGDEMTGFLGIGTVNTNPLTVGYVDSGAVPTSMVKLDYDWSPAAFTSAYYPAALVVTSDYNSVATQTSGFISGIRSYTSVASTGIMTVRNMDLLTRNLSTGTVGTMVNIWSRAAVNSGAGTITNYYAFHISNSDAAVVNSYGIYQEGGTTINAFEGFMRIGSLSAVSGGGAVLEVDGGVIFQDTSKTSNSKFRFIHDDSTGYNYIQAGESNADTGAKLRISRYYTSANLAEVEIRSDLFVLRGDTEIYTDAGILVMTLSNTNSVGVAADILIESSGILAADDNLYLLFDADNNSANQSLLIGHNAQNTTATLWAAFTSGEQFVIGATTADEKFHVSTAAVQTGARIGNLFTGVWTNNQYAVWAHYTIKSGAALGTSYALLQADNGNTFLNSAAATQIRVLNSSLIYVNATGVAMGIAATAANANAALHIRDKPLLVDKGSVHGTVSVAESIRICGGFTDTIFAWQDGTGYYNHYLNSSIGASPTFLVGGVDAQRVYMSGEWFHWSVADGSTATAGDPITWVRRLSIRPGGQVVIGNTTGSDTDMAEGLFIKPGTNIATHYMSFSDAGVSAGFADYDAGIFGAVYQIGAGSGGLQITGISEISRGLVLEGWALVADASTSTASLGAVTIIGAEKNPVGTNPVQVAAADNILVVRNYNTTAFIFKGNGDFRYDNAQSPFDDFDDVGLLKTFNEVTSLKPGFKYVDDVWQNFIDYNRQDLVDADIISADGMISLASLNKLLVGAILQQAVRVMSLKDKIELLEERLTKYENR